MSAMSLRGTAGIGSGASRVSGAQVAMPQSARLSSAGSLRCPVRMAQSLQGKVVSTKAQDTIVVAVDRFVPHPIYKKRCRVTKRYNVHAPGGTEVELGDIIEINPCRPISKSKRFVAGGLVSKRD